MSKDDLPFVTINDIIYQVIDMKYKINCHVVVTLAPVGIITTENRIEAEHLIDSIKQIENIK